MERDTFDRLVRLFADARSRRAALRLAIGGAVLGVATVEETAARRRRKRRRVQAQQVPGEVPEICLIPGGTGCSKPQGNCANKRIGPGANLTNCNFITPSGGVFQTNFAGANLTGTCWLADDLFNRPNFKGANLTNACFFEAELDFADFRGANLKGATFCLADLTGADFRGSNLTQEQLARAQRFACNTILPNGKPAVKCAAGQTCDPEFSDCTCQQDSDCSRTGLNCNRPACVSGFCECFEF
jgi:hypothetical protein